MHFLNVVFRLQSMKFIKNEHELTSTELLKTINMETALLTTSTHDWIMPNAKSIHKLFYHTIFPLFVYSFLTFCFAFGRVMDGFDYIFLWSVFACLNVLCIRQPHFIMIFIWWESFSFTNTHKIQQAH